MQVERWKGPGPTAGTTNGRPEDPRVISGLRYPINLLRVNITVHTKVGGLCADISATRFGMIMTKNAADHQSPGQ